MTAPADPVPLMSRVRRAIVVALVLLHGWMALSVLPRVGLTFDEPAHLTAGRSYWATGDYRLQPENGNLPQRLVALPATIRGEPFPAAENAAFRRADVWDLARAYLFGAEARDVGRLVNEARAMTVLLGVALAALIYGWARELFGRHGALIALAAAAFCPHLLAHAGLAASDLAATLGFALATWTWWRLLHAVTWARLALAGTAAGLLALTKFSAVLFAPVALALLLVRLTNREPLPVPGNAGSMRNVAGIRRVVPLGLASLGTVLVAVAVIWTAYGGRFAATPAGAEERTFQLPWSTVLMEEQADAAHRPGIVQAFVREARDRQLLPEAFLYGLTYTDYFSRARAAFFAGEHRTTGWRSFFPTVFAMKTTLPALLLLGLALASAAVALRRDRTLLYRTAPLWVFAAVYGAFAIRSQLNIGHRHLLPLYPILYVALGAVALPRLAPIRWAGPVVAGLLLWHAVESWRVRPHYLTYFNALAGGPAGAHRYFVDSSLDWGQGLPDLARWLEEAAPNEPVYLAYFGTDEPSRHGIQAIPIIGGVIRWPGDDVLHPLTPGIYCVSATRYRRVYSGAQGPWTMERELAYRRLLARAPLSEPSERRALEELRFARLCNFLETRAPDAVVANSILVFRLGPVDLAEAIGEQSGYPSAR